MTMPMLTSPMTGPEKTFSSQVCRSLSPGLSSTGVVHSWSGPGTIVAEMEQKSQPGTFVAISFQYSSISNGKFA